MADQTIDKAIGDLPQAATVQDDSLIPVEQQGEAMHMTGAQFKAFARGSVQEYVTEAQTAANEAKQAVQGIADDAEAAAQAAARAESARDEAVSASEGVDQYVTDAQAAAQAAQTAQAGAESAKQDAETAASGVAENAQAAIDAKAAAEQAAQTASDAKADAESAQGAAQQAASYAEASIAATAQNAQAAAQSASTAQAAAGSAGAYADSASESADEAERWAKEAQSIAGGGVTSFNGRGGTVTPQAGDYTAEMVGADPAGAAAAAAGEVQGDLDRHKEDDTRHLMEGERDTWNAKSGKAESTAVTLLASGWSGGQQTVLDDFIIAEGYDYIVAPEAGSYGVYAGSMIRASDISVDGAITFTAEEVPGEDITVNILRIEVEADG